MGLSARASQPGIEQVARPSRPALEVVEPGPHTVEVAQSLSAWHASLPRRQPATRGRLAAVGFTIAAHAAAVALVLTTSTLVVPSEPESLTATVITAPPAQPDQPTPVSVEPPTLEMPTPVRPLLPVPVVRVEHVPPTRLSLPPAPPAPPTASVAPQGTAGASSAPASAATAVQAGAAETSYDSRLLGHLQKHKRYPRAALTTKLQGVVWVRVRFDRQGHVISAKLERSSGRRILDSEAMELMSRADPFPAVPEDIRGAELERVVPIEFFLT